MPHRASDTEQTWTEVTTFRQIRRKHLVNWAILGMITEAVLTPQLMFSRRRYRYAGSV
jgi:hypothetical protein